MKSTLFVYIATFSMLLVSFQTFSQHISKENAVHDPLQSEFSRQVRTQFFYEDWISESFLTNGWTFEPSQGNWVIDMDDGNPVPSAKFHYQPLVTNYSFSLVSQVISITGADYLTLTFDLFFFDYAYTGNEHLKVWIWNDTFWDLVTEFSNTGDIPWTTFSYNLIGIDDDTTQIRFEATGLNSYDINNWFLDNIELSDVPLSYFQLTPLSYDFGQVVIDSISEPHSFFLCNTGVGPVTVDTVVLDSTNASEFILYDSNSYPLTINEGDSAVVSVSFSPQTIGFKIANLVVTTDIGIYESVLTGTGYTNKEFELTPSNYDFGQIMVDSVSPPQVFTMSNTGVGSILVNSVTLGGANAAQFILNDTNSYPLTINEGDSSLFEVMFAPLTTGVMNATIDVSTEIGNYVSYLTGEGYSIWSFEITPDQYDFEQILVDSTSAPQTFTLSNTGIGDILVSAVLISGPDATDFILNDTNNYPLSLSMAESIQVEVSFAPQTVGMKTAGLVVSTDIGAYDATLTGEGIVSQTFEIPFLEDWISEDFETNGWTFEPSQGNWIIDLDAGNPLPAAKFHYQPVVTNYSYSLVSPIINTFGADSLMYAFDLMFSDYASSNSELLNVWVWNDNTWQLLTTFDSQESLPWANYSFQLMNLVGDQTRIRFEATGLNSDDINNWNVDNISIYSMELYPEISVDPTSIYQELIFDSVATQELIISNSGLGILEFEASIVYLDTLNPQNWLFIAPDTGNINPSEELPIIVTFDTEGLNRNTVYFANIIINSNDPITPTVIVPVTLSIIVDVEKHVLSLPKIYPNPARKTVSLSGLISPCNIHITEMSGKVVYESFIKDKTTLEIDLEGLDRGFYIIHFNSSDEYNFTRKLIIAE